ncbi:hypothetical protein WNY37_18145 [Henriciella sp. AS95]|uniref:hypothetical protein n=1 Tax=Henriciella sp. AS95 TaxID=3135782 RepID=UPI003174A3B0
MSENAQSSNGALYFIVGALVVAVIGFGIWYFAGQPASNGGGGDADLSVSVSEDGMTVNTPDE